MDQLKSIWSSLTIGQRVSLAGMAIAVLGGLLWFSAWRTASDYRPLYLGMAEADAAQATEALKTANIPYRFNENGDTSILVPSGQLAEARLLLAREGLPKSGRIGFELFDQTSFGTTDFAEQINYQRALEGELERTVMTLSEVERARVHVTFSKDSVFSDYRQPAKASIVLTLHRNAALSKGNISAIANLAASAVEGLSPEQVTLVDDRGNLLNKPRGGTGSAGNDMVSAPDSQIEFRATLERSVLDKVTQALDPVLGNGRYRTGVSVDCDFSGVDESEEIWDPTKSVMTSNQVTDESSTGRAGGGVPGTAANLPAPPPQAPQRTGTTRHTENTSYQTSRKVRHVQQARGTVKRITLAVLLDQESRWVGAGKDAKLTFIPPTPEKIAVIRNMVVNVAGIDAQRGDQVTVESLPFETTERSDPAVSAPAKKQDSPVEQLMNLDKRILIAIGAGAVLLIVVTGFLFSRRGKRAKAKPVATAQIEAAGVDALPAAATAQLHAGAGDREEDLLLALRAASRSTNTAEALTKFLREEVHKDPRNVALLLRSWLEEERAH